MVIPRHLLTGSRYPDKELYWILYTVNDKEFCSCLILTPFIYFSKIQIFGTYIMSIGRNIFLLCPWWCDFLLKRKVSFCKTLKNDISSKIFLNLRVSILSNKTPQFKQKNIGLGSMCLVKICLQNFTKSIEVSAIIYR